MELWKELAGWEQVSIIAFDVSLLAYLPSIKIRSQGSSQVIVCLLLIGIVAWVAPIFGFGLMAWGFSATSYVVFVAILLIPQYVAWKKNGTSVNT